jgi:hypothetical protein
MKPATFYVNGKRIDVTLPKPEPLHRRFDFIEAVSAIKSQWLWLAVVLVILSAVLLGVEIR